MEEISTKILSEMDTNEIIKKLKETIKTDLDSRYDVAEDK